MPDTGDVYDILQDISEFLENYEDADMRGDPPEYVPNEAMQLRSRVDAMIEGIDKQHDLSNKINPH